MGSVLVTVGTDPWTTSLREISRHFYGTPNLWTRIYNANLNKITNPERIFPGQVLNVPTPD